MDKYITSETNGLNIRPTFFEPLKPQTKPPTKLEFHLIIGDSSSDSSLTPNWTLPFEALSVPVSVCAADLLSRLRDKLPSPTSSASITNGTTPTRTTADSPTSTATSGRRSTDPAAARANGTPTRPRFNLRLAGHPRRPKLASATLYLMSSSGGKVVPLCRNDRDWHYRCGFARVDLMDRTEAEWRLFKDLLVAAEGEFKCYIAIKAAPTRSLFRWAN